MPIGLYEFDSILESNVGDKGFEEAIYRLIARSARKDLLAQNIFPQGFDGLYIVVPTSMKNQKAFFIHVQVRSVAIVKLGNENESS